MINCKPSDLTTIMDFFLLLLLFPGGLRAVLTDQNKLVVAVGGVTAVAAGIYTTRLIQNSQISYIRHVWF